MADQQPMIASAVVVPDQASPSRSPGPPSPSSPTSRKRRQSSVSNSGNKRSKLDTDLQSNGTKATESRGSPEYDRRNARQQNGKAEERKRGKRLFGALLGTLSQSSTSTAQKRREIERRQQAKIKQQADEDDQTTRQKVEEIKTVRRREQRIYDEQAMRTRHSNFLARANFLQTRAEPKLYYRPWDLRPDEEDQIKQQVEDIQAQNEVELEEHRRNQEHEVEKDRGQEGHKGKEEPDPEILTDAPPEQQQWTDQQDRKTSARVDSEKADHPAEPSDTPDGDTNHEDTVAAEQQPKSVEPDEHDRDGGDDNGEEMLEAEEDTVLY